MEELNRAKQFLDEVLTNIQTGILVFDSNGIISFANNKSFQYFGIPKQPENGIGQHVKELISHKRIIERITKSLKNNTNFRISNINVKNRYLLIEGKTMTSGMIVNITDVTSDVVAKDKATQSLILGQEMERRRLAKEIHDGVGPSMSTLKLQIDGVKKKLSDKSVQDALEIINQNISEIANDIRMISHDLMPSSLIDYGVVTALSNFCNRIRESGEVDVIYKSDISDGYLTKEHEFNIYRIVQELANNALKYSQCNVLEISLMEAHNGIQLIVRDDGKGIDKELTKKGMGLHNISTRVETLHGKFSLESELGKGATANIVLPATK